MQLLHAFTTTHFYGNSKPPPFSLTAVLTSGGKPAFELFPTLRRWYSTNLGYRLDRSTAN